MNLETKIFLDFWDTVASRIWSFHFKNAQFCVQNAHFWAKKIFQKKLSETQSHLDIKIFQSLISGFLD